MNIKSNEIEKIKLPVPLDDHLHKGSPPRPPDECCCCFFVVVVVLVGTWWYWVSMWRFWLVLSDFGSGLASSDWYLVVLGQ